MDIKPAYIALEITATKAKLAAGHCQHGKPILLYLGEKDISKFMDGTKIVDAAGLAGCLTGFALIDDPDKRLKMTVDQVGLCIPPIGFTVYQSERETGTVSRKVERVDITNVNELVMKDPVPNGNTILDIVPQYFIVDGAKRFDRPPIGEEARFIQMISKVHTMPSYQLYVYRNAVQSSNLRIAKTSVSSYCASLMIGSDESMPQNYFYVDMGSRITTITFVAGKAPYGSLILEKGSEHLTEKIAQTFKISNEDAETIKVRYGYSKTHHNFDPAIGMGRNKEDKVVPFGRAHLDRVIKAFFEDYDKEIANAIQTLVTTKSSAKGDPGVIAKYPVILGGGGSKLNHLDDLLIETKRNRSLIHFIPDVPGGRDPSCINVLGMLIAGDTYKGTLEDDRPGVVSLTRQTTQP